MGDLYKQNLKKLTGVRDELSTKLKHLLRLEDLKSTTGSILITAASGGGVTFDFGGTASGVAGPGGGSTDEAIARWNGTTGGLLQDSPVTIGDAGLISGGIWGGTAIGVPFGGTGRTSVPANNILLGAGTGVLTTLSPGSNGQVLTIVGGAPVWSTSPSGGPVTLNGDVFGPSSSTTVSGLQNRPVSSAAPSVGQALTWTGAEWAPQTVATSGGSGGGTSSVTGVPVTATSGQPYYAVASSNYLILVQDSGSVTVVLPPTPDDGRTVQVKDASPANPDRAVNPIIILPSGSDTIDGETSTSIVNTRQAFTLTYHMGDWALL